MNCLPFLGHKKWEVFLKAREPALRAKHTGQKTTRYAGG